MSDTPDPATAIAASLATLTEAIAPMQEATIGYRQSLIDKGMGKDAADRCAADFHAFLLGMLPSPRYGQGAKR